MAVIAPDPTESAAPRWLGAFVETWEPGHRRGDRGSRAGHGPTHRDGPRLNADDVARAAAAAKAPSPPGLRRATRSERAILRRAADIYDENRAEFGKWTMRETGASHSKMHHESNFAYGEILAAATLPVAALWLARAHRRQGSPLDDPAHPGRGRRGDHALELAERPRHAGRRSGARARQCRHPQARSADAGDRRRDVRGRLSGSRACPRDCSRSWSAGPTSARRWSPTRTCRSCRSRDRRLRAGGSASWPAAGSRRSRSSWVGTTRSSSWTTRTWTPRRPPARSRRSSSRARSASPQGATSSTSASPSDYIDALREKAQRLRMGDPYREDVQLGSDREREAGPPRGRHRPALRSTAGRGSSRGGTYEGLFYDRRCSPT